MHSSNRICIQSESSGTLYNTQIPTNHSFSQPTTSQPIYPQNALIYASQPQNSIPILNPVQLQNVEQNSSLNSENQCKKFSRKRNRNLDDQGNLNAKKQDYWLGGTITTTNRFSTLAEHDIEEEAKNIHPSTDLNVKKQRLTDKGHVVTNIWKVKE